MKHIPEIKGIPGNLPRKGHEDSSSTGHKYQGTSLRDLQNHRNNKNKRSSSAPPPTTTSRNQHQQTMITTTPDTSSSLSKQYLWQNRGHGGGDKKPFSTRFAATPLAQYLKLRHGQEPSSPYIPVNDTQNMTPMRTSELNSSIASSISFHKDDPYVMSSKGGYLRTELHDLNGNEASEMESRVR